MRWLRWVPRVAIWTVTAVVVLVVGGVLFLTRTEPGVRIVVEQAVSRLQGSVRGTITYQGVASPDLLGGAEIYGLEIRDDDGRLFLRSDTLEAGYSILRALTGDIVLHDVRATGLTVVVERLPDQEEVNAVRIFAPGPPEPDSARRQGPARTILIQGAEIERGEIQARLPVPDVAELPQGAYTVEAPGGAGLMREYAFRDLEAWLPRVSVSAPDQEGERIQVARLATTAEIQSRPVRIESFRGRVARVGSELTLDGTALELPESAVRGEVAVDWGDGEVVASGNLDADPVALAELRWILPELPEARVVGAVGFRFGGGSTVLDLEDAVATTDSSRVRAVGEVRVGQELRFTNLRLDLNPLAATDLTPWLEEPLPYEGGFQGTVEIDGLLDELGVGGDVELVRDGLGPTRVVFSGSLGMGDQLEVEGLALEVDPLDFALVESFFPERTFRGNGSLVAEASGSLAEGISVTVDLEHEAQGLSRSRVEGTGTIRSDTTDVYLGFDGEVDPLNLGVVEMLAPETSLSGAVEGPVRVSGRLGELRVEAELQAPAGRLAFDARFDARDLASGYSLDATVEAFELSQLVDSLPSPTRVTGGLSARGRGLDRESLEADVSLHVESSRVARFTVDTARAVFRVGAGEIGLDTLEARTNLARISGSGALGMDAEHPDAELRILLRNDSLETVRPLLLGDTVIAADTLSPLERELLLAGGVNPDTLPTEAAVALEGRLTGEITVRGWVDAFTADGTVSVQELIYGSNFVRDASGTFTASRLPGLDGGMEATLEADSIFWSGRRLSGARLEAAYTRPAGNVLLEIRRHDAEDYRARASFEADSLEGSVELEELALRFDDVQWMLERTALLDWDPSAIRVRDFTLGRPGVDSMRIQADGVIPREGDAEFDLQIRRLSLARVARLAQMEADGVEGSMDVDLRLRGTASQPVATGLVAIDSLRYRNVLLTRAEGNVDYQDRRASGTLQAWRGDLLAARVEGGYPLDLSLDEMEVGIPPEPMDLRAVVDSFPLAGLSTVAEALDDVQGTVSGEVGVTGLPDDIDATGSLEVQGGAFTLAGLGIRPQDVNGTIALEGTSTATVDLQARSLGEVAIQGTMNVGTPTNPELDLQITGSGFQAVDRRDLQVRLGGDLSLTGTYSRPVITGAARVDEGVLRIEEFERSADVIDLSDPRFFDVVDTSFVAMDPALQPSQNPFVQNLRVQVDLSVQRNTWLRSQAMNVEMGGDLVINWNRNSGDLVLTGELNAIRGTYSLYGRQFQVQEGAVEFVGTPGLDPNLSIEAVTRLRTDRRVPLNIMANVSGTLQEPRVTLSSDAQPAIAQSDLVSYLIFGRPSYALGSSQAQVFQRAVGAASSVALGALGTVVQETGLGLDYLSVSQEASFGDDGTGSFADIGGAVSSTEVEVGQYLTENIFVSAIFRPLSGVGETANRNPWRGVRAEWQMGDVWTLESFFEDRFTRENISFGTLGEDFAEIYGLFLYREWGY